MADFAIQAKAQDVNTLLQNLQMICTIFQQCWERQVLRRWHPVPLLRSIRLDTNCLTVYIARTPQGEQMN